MSRVVEVLWSTSFSNQLPQAVLFGWYNILDSNKVPGYEDLERVPSLPKTTNT